MPVGKTAIGCGGETYSGTTKTAATCTCDLSTAVTPEAATWTCVTTDSEMVQKPCPAQDDPKVTGESCAGLLSEPDSLQKCMWSRRTSMDVDVESFWCTCANTGESANVWDCDGAFAPPASASTADDGMMAADTPQEIITPVVPPAGATGTGTMSECPATQVKTGDSCAGFLQGTLQEAACTFSQTTQENNDAPVTTLTTCSCQATDPSWTCAEPVDEPVDLSKADEDTNVDDVDVTEATAEATADTDGSNLATDEVTAATNEAAADVTAATTEATADVNEEADAVTADVKDKTQEVTADIKEKTNEADTEIADKTQEADTDIADK